MPLFCVPELRPTQLEGHGKLFSNAKGPRPTFVQPNYVMGPWWKLSVHDMLLSSPHKFLGDSVECNSESNCCVSFF